MKKQMIFGALMAAFLAATPAMAGHHEGGPHGDKKGAKMMERIDTDKDGFLTKDEMLEAHKARLDEMFERDDTNGDGKLSPEELKAAKESFKDRMKERREKWKERKESKDGASE
jgi:Ca2+-binding EF-hand superfamily protein